MMMKTKIQLPQADFEGKLKFTNPTQSGLNFYFP